MTPHPHPTADLILCSEAGSGGPRIWTFLLTYWRVIHCELLTHRVFSRNSASSRAIPVARMLEAVRTQPQGPLHWGANQKGMRAEAECEELVHIPSSLKDAFFRWRYPDVYGAPAISTATREEAWAFSRHLATEMAGAMADAGYHKQIVNRLTEPFQTMRVVVTTTELENFFALRNHKDAMPEFKALAEQMRRRVEEATPQTLGPGEWHLPFVGNPVDGPLGRIGDLARAIRHSTACCAHTSYQTVDGAEMSEEKAEEIVAKLLKGDPLHASPFEHQATPIWGDCTTWRRNFREPWKQHRAFVEQGISPIQPDESC